MKNAHIKNLEKNFKEPPRKYGVYPFWFLNHRLTEKEIDRQIGEMSRNGVPGFFIHARGGLFSPPYGSRRWFETVMYIVATAKKLGISAEIYDEMDCPSGTAGESVTMRNPQYSAMYLYVWSEKVRGGPEVDLPLPEGRLLKLFARKGKKIVDVTESVGVCKKEFSYHLNWTSKFYYPTERDYRHSRAITVNPQFHLSYVLPAGDWDITAFYVRSFSDERHDYIDVLNPEATDAFIDSTHRRYKELLGDEFGKTVHFFFTDEPKMFAPLPYTGNLENAFRQKYGYSILDNLPHLIYDIGEKSESVRHDYRNLLKELFIDSFVLKLRKWCNENNLKLTGHVSPEEHISQESWYLGSVMSVLENFDMPGTDIIIPAIGDREHNLLNRTVLVAVSAGERMGSPVLCESFACGNWDFAPADMKKITDWLFVLGVNFLVPHAFFYSIDGLRKHEAPPSFFYQSSYWNQFHKYAQYVRRLSFIMQNTEPLAKVALVYPISTAWQILPTGEKQVLEEEKKLNDVIYHLLSNQIRMHLITEEMLERSEVKNGTLCLGRCRYSVVLALKSTALSVRARGKIEELTGSGGKFMYLDAAGGAAGILKDCQSENVKITGEGRDRIFCLEKKDSGEVFYFLMNVSREEIDVEIKLQGWKKVRRWVLESGAVNDTDAVQKNNETLFRVKFLPHQSFLFSAEDCRLENMPYVEATVKKIKMEKRWEIRPVMNFFVLNKWEIAVDGRKKTVEPAPLYRHFPELAGKEWRETVFGKIPGLERFPRGKAVEYRCRVMVNEAPDYAELIVEKDSLGEECVISVNGRPVSRLRNKTVYDGFNYVSVITPLLKKGRNIFTVRMVARGPQDGLVQPLMIHGNFSVSRRGGKWEIYAPAKALNAGSWTGQGYPFYSGTVSYLNNFYVDESEYGQASSIWLNFPDVRDTVEIKVNGMPAGSLLWPPYRVEIKKYVKPGRNRVELCVTNSMANLFSCKRKISGLLRPPYMEICK